MDSHAWSSKCHTCTMSQSEDCDDIGCWREITSHINREPRFGSLWDSSSSRLGSTPPSASSTAHCRQQPLLRESPPVARARPHTFHAVYCLGVSPTPPGGLERPVIRVTRAPRIKNQGSTPPSASSTEHCRQQPLLRESPPVARARPHTFHAVYCLGVSPTPPGDLERPVIRVTRAPRIKNL